MESNELRIFKAVAQEGSITKAAKIMGYVQSNVTARIQQLESELKTPLFYRQHGMILTPAGEKLKVYAEQIIHLLDEANLALNDADNPVGSLSIGASPTISSFHLPEILAQYHQSYPKVDLSFITSNTDELITKLLHFQLDGAFVKSLSFSDDNIVKELVFEETLVLISSPQYHDLKTVCSKPFLMNTTGCPNRILLENWLTLNGIHNIRIMEFNTLDAIIEGVMADLGASFVPQSAVKKYEESGRLQSFSIPAPYNAVKTFFIRHKDSQKTSALSKFMEMIELKTPYHSMVRTAG